MKRKVNSAPHHTDLYDVVQARCQIFPASLSETGLLYTMGFVSVNI